MRQVFFYLTILCLPLAFIACQSGTTKTNSETTSTTNETVVEAPYQNIGIGEFREKMNDDNVVILDVRTPEEIAEGKVEGAIEIDYKADDFSEKIDALDRDKTYLVYCRSGGRSSRSCMEMAEKGFEDVYNLMGGYMGWEATIRKME